MDVYAINKDEFQELAGWEKHEGEDYILYTNPQTRDEILIRSTSFESKKDMNSFLMDQEFNNNAEKGLPFELSELESKEKVNNGGDSLDYYYDIRTEFTLESNGNPFKENITNTILVKRSGNTATIIEYRNFNFDEGESSGKTKEEMDTFAYQIMRDNDNSPIEKHENESEQPDNAIETGQENADTATETKQNDRDETLGKGDSADVPGIKDSTEKQGSQTDNNNRNPESQTDNNQNSKDQADSAEKYDEQQDSKPETSREDKNTIRFDDLDQKNVMWLNKGVNAYMRIEQGESENGAPGINLVFFEKTEDGFAADKQKIFMPVLDMNLSKMEQGQLGRSQVSNTDGTANISSAYDFIDGFLHEKTNHDIPTNRFITEEIVPRIKDIAANGLKGITGVDTKAATVFDTEAGNDRLDIKSITYNLGNGFECKVSAGKNTGAEPSIKLEFSRTEYNEKKADLIVSMRGNSAEYSISVSKGETSLQTDAEAKIKDYFSGDNGAARQKPKVSLKDFLTEIIPSAREYIYERGVDTNVAGRDCTIFISNDRSHNDLISEPKNPRTSFDDGYKYDASIIDKKTGNVIFGENKTKDAVERAYYNPDSGERIGFSRFVFEKDKSGAVTGISRSVFTDGSGKHIDLNSFERKIGQAGFSVDDSLTAYKNEISKEIRNDRVNGVSSNIEGYATLMSGIAERISENFADKNVSKNADVFEKSLDGILSGIKAADNGKGDVFKTVINAIGKGAVDPANREKSVSVLLSMGLYRINPKTNKPEPSYAMKGLMEIAMVFNTTKTENDNAISEDKKGNGVFYDAVCRDVYLKIQGIKDEMLEKEEKAGIFENGTRKESLTQAQAQALGSIISAAVAQIKETLFEPINGASTAVDEILGRDTESDRTRSFGALTRVASRAYMQNIIKDLPDSAKAQLAVVVPHGFFKRNADGEYEINEKYLSINQDGILTNPFGITFDGKITRTTNGFTDSAVKEFAEYAYHVMSSSADGKKPDMLSIRKEFIQLVSEDGQWLKEALNDYIEGKEISDDKPENKEKLEKYGNVMEAIKAVYDYEKTEKIKGIELSSIPFDASDFVKMNKKDVDASDAATAKRNGIDLGEEKDEKGGNNRAKWKGFPDIDPADPLREYKEEFQSLNVERNAYIDLAPVSSMYNRFLGFKLTSAMAITTAWKHHLPIETSSGEKMYPTTLDMVSEWVDLYHTNLIEGLVMELVAGIVEAVRSTGDKADKPESPDIDKPEGKNGEKDSPDNPEPDKGDSPDKPELDKGDSPDKPELDKGDSPDKPELDKGDSPDNPEPDKGDSLDKPEPDKGDSPDNPGNQTDKDGQNPESQTDQDGRNSESQTDKDNQNNQNKENQTESQKTTKEADYKKTGTEADNDTYPDIQKNILDGSSSDKLEPSIKDKYHKDGNNFFEKLGNTISHAIDRFSGKIDILRNRIDGIFGIVGKVTQLGIGGAIDKTVSAFRTSSHWIEKPNFAGMIAAIGVGAAVFTVNPAFADQVDESLMGTNENPITYENKDDDVEPALVAEATMEKPGKGETDETDKQEIDADLKQDKETEANKISSENIKMETDENGQIPETVESSEAEDDVEKHEPESASFEASPDSEEAAVPEQAVSGEDSGTEIHHDDTEEAKTDNEWPDHVDGTAADHGTPASEIYKDDTGAESALSVEEPNESPVEAIKGLIEDFFNPDSMLYDFDDLCNTMITVNGEDMSIGEYCFSEDAEEGVKNFGDALASWLSDSISIPESNMQDLPSMMQSLETTPANTGIIEECATKLEGNAEAQTALSDAIENIPPIMVANDEYGSYMFDPEAIDDINQEAIQTVDAIVDGTDLAGSQDPADWTLPSWADTGIESVAATDMEQPVEIDTQSTIDQTYAQPQDTENAIQMAENAAVNDTSSDKQRNSDLENNNKAAEEDTATDFNDPVD